MGWVQRDCGGAQNGSLVRMSHVLLSLSLSLSPSLSLSLSIILFYYSALYFTAPKFKPENVLGCHTSFPCAEGASRLPPTWSPIYHIHAYTYSYSIQHPTSLSSIKRYRWLAWSLSVFLTPPEMHWTSIMHTSHSIPNILINARNDERWWLLSRPPPSA